MFRPSVVLWMMCGNNHVTPEIPDPPAGEERELSYQRDTMNVERRQRHRPFRSAALISLSLAVWCVSHASAQQPPARGPVLPKIHRGEGWAIAAPSPWTVDENILRPTVLKLRGEGTRGFARLDGTLAPLTIGLLVERHDPRAGDVQVVADVWKKRMQTGGTMQLVGQIIQREAQLTGSTAALLLIAKKESDDKSRIASYYGVVCADKSRNVVVVTGSLQCSSAARAFVGRSGMLSLLKAHVASVVVDGVDVDPKRLGPAYAKYDWRAADAIDLTCQANRLLERRNPTQAAAVLRSAISASDDVPAAHQRLAWLHVTATDPKLLRPEIALPHARRAVELTNWGDIRSLDALTLVYSKLGQRDQIADIFREALKRHPKDAIIRQRLSRYR